MYEYYATVVSVYDGDTIRVNIDLGFNIKMANQEIRLNHVDTPELRGEEKEEGQKVRDFVREMILNKSVLIKTYKDEKGKFGRWLGDVFYSKTNIVTASSKRSELTNLNQELLNLGYAEEY